MKLKSNESNIWFTSDTHYYHKNICRGVSAWDNPEEKCRDFDTVKEMSVHIVHQINACVGENDILFHLGDWSFGGIQNIWNFKKQLLCKEIHLIMGNHDGHIIKDKVLTNTYGVNGVFSMTAQKIFSSAQHYLEVQIDDTLVMMFHRAIADYHNNEWSDSKIYHLHGHSHGNYPIAKNRLDVGMDNYYKLFSDYKPFSWEQIKTLMNEHI